MKSRTIVMIVGLLLPVIPITIGNNNIHQWSPRNMFSATTPVDDAKIYLPIFKSSSSPSDHIYNHRRSLAEVFLKNFSGRPFTSTVDHTAFDVRMTLALMFIEK